MTPHVRRALLLVIGLLILTGTTGAAQARCVTVGADGTTYTNCLLP